MTSAAQELANRSNAQKSTGPRTAQGKAVVAQNAVKHGLLAKEVVVKGEDPGEFELYRDQMLAELAPLGQMESMLAHRIVGLAWRLRRAERLQAAAFDKVEDPSKPPELVLSPEQASRLLAVLAETGVQPPEPVAAGPAVGRRAVQDFDRERILDRLLVYERRIESSLYRTMGELRKLRLLREMEPLADRAMVERGLACSTGILPVSSMGVPPMTAEDMHGQDARDTHGRDAHATRPPEGGTTNGAEAQEQSCETNPIGPEVSSSKSEVSSGGPVLPTSHFPLETSPEPPCGGTTNGVAGSPGLPTSNGTLPTADGSACGVGTNMPQAPELSYETNPISARSNAGGTPNGTEGQEPACETKPISAAAKKDPVPYVAIFRRRR